MLRKTTAFSNFFAFGRRRGPSNPIAAVATRETNDTDVAQFPTGTPVSRHQLRCACCHCRIVWRFDRAAVVCAANPSHAQIELGYHHTWYWNRTQPVHWIMQLGPHGMHPKTGHFLSREDSKSTFGRERRIAGCPTNYVTSMKWKNKISREVTNIGAYNTRWKTRFPYPS